MFEIVRWSSKILKAYYSIVMSMKNGIVILLTFFLIHSNKTRLGLLNVFKMCLFPFYHNT